MKTDKDFNKLLKVFHKVGWKNITQKQILSLIYRELDKLLPINDYWESDEHYKNSNLIYDYCLGNKLITQEWLDNTLRHLDDERLMELLPIVFKNYRRNVSRRLTETLMNT
tara:strand:- start:1450 stop:1782 length:333 start_codon:yes stop_codon:yes gene_type:complete